MQIVEREGSRVVGIQVVADWKNLWTEVPQAWKQLFERADEIRDRTAETFVDVSLEMNDGVYTELVGAEVNEAGTVPEGMVQVELPTRRYVHLRHEGPVAGIADAFGRMHAWADENEITTDDFKIDRGYTPGGDETVHDLYVRLAD